MAQRYRRGLTLYLAVSVCAVCCAATDSSLSAQTDSSPEAATTAKAPSYEIVSIRPSDPNNREVGWRSLPDGLNYINLPLQPLIKDVYGLDMDSQISGLPGWVNSERYDVQARVDADTAIAWKKLSEKEISALQRPMIQSLLADRCHLRVHLETRDFSVYDLVIAKGGLKIKEAPADKKTDASIQDDSLTGSAAPFEFLVTNLPSWSGRMVIDKTGLAGKRFAMQLRWTSDDRRTATDDGPSIFTALQEQLGLKLVPSQAPMKVAVIVHIERPSPN